jgi:oligosaccharide repeat unit polymerase
VDSLLLVALACLPLAVGGFARMTERSWVAPSAFFGFLWGAVAVPAALVFGDVPGLASGLIWIFIASLAVWAGALAARPLSTWGTEERPEPEMMRMQLPGLRILPAFALVAGVLEIVFLFARRGFSLTSILSYVAIAQLTAANRSEYIYGDLQQGTLERVALLLLYCGTLFGGMLFRLRRSRLEGGLGLAPLLLTLLVFGLYGSRMGALYGGSFWVGSYLATTILAGDWTDLVGWRFLFRVGLVAGLLGFGFSVGTQVLRYSTSSRGFNWQSILGDGVSFVAAFGLWFKDHLLQASDFVWGGRVFRKLVAPFGLDQPIALEIDVGFTSSNIFTVLRDLIEDFGIVGAALFLFSYGFAGRVLFAHVARGGIRATGVLALVYAFALTSVAFSIFSYTITAAAVFGFMAYCAVAPSLPRRWGWPGPAADSPPGVAATSSSHSG